MSGPALDFTTLSDIELEQFAVLHQDALAISGLVQDDIVNAVAAGRATIERRPNGFAVIERQIAADGTIPHLWLLFIAPELQGKGLGHRLMRELLRQHASVYHMSLYCYGVRRRAFFGRLGFRIESQDGEMRRMTTNTLR